MSAPLTTPNADQRIPTAGATAVTAEPMRRTASAVAGPRPVARAWYGSWQFSVCAMVLLAAAVTRFSLSSWIQGLFEKEPVPLKKPIPEMEAAKLAPEFELHPLPPEAIDAETLETLGTHEYIIWRLVDRAKSRDDTTCVAHVFITYYTGKPDMVPHVPDECMKAAGGDQVSAEDTHVRVRGIGAPDDEVPVRVLEFLMPQTGSGFGGIAPPPRRSAVSYFFHWNGQYVGSRDGMRFASAFAESKYAYYSKIEISFSDFSLRKEATVAETTAALPKVTAKVMRILLDDHFQDWNQLNARTAGEHVPAAKP